MPLQEPIMNSDWEQTQTVANPDRSKPRPQQTQTAANTDRGKPRPWLTQTTANPDSSKPRSRKTQTAENPDRGKSRLWQTQTMANPDCGKPRLQQTQTVANPDHGKPGPQQTRTAPNPDHGKTGPWITQNAANPDHGKPGLRKTRTTENPECGKPGPGQTQTTAKPDCGKPRPRQTRTAVKPDHGKPGLRQTQTVANPDHGKPGPWQTRNYPRYSEQLSIQWLRNDGKCGVCGDAFHGSRHHEAGGKYATGLISRTFREGDIITITVHLTANHLGFFEFRICPNNDPKKSVTQECLDKYLLERPNGEGTRYFVPKGKYNSFFNYTLKLPEGLTCNQCVLQWKYRTGNTWDQDGATGLFCLGCGPQEEFYNCADIAIAPRSGMKKKRYDLLQSKTSKKQIATRPTIFPTKRKKKTHKKPPKSPFLTDKPAQRPKTKATTSRPKTKRREYKLSTTHRPVKKTQKLKSTKNPTTRYKKEPTTRKPSSGKPSTVHHLSISKHIKLSKRTTTNTPRTPRLPTTTHAPRTPQMKIIKNGMGTKEKSDSHEKAKTKKTVTKIIPWSTKTVERTENPKLTTKRKTKTYTNHGKIISEDKQSTAKVTKNRLSKATVKTKQTTNSGLVIGQTKPERIKHILNGQHGSMNGKDNRPMLIANDIRTRKPTTKRVRQVLKTTIKNAIRTLKPTTKRVRPLLKATIKTTRRTPKATTKRVRHRIKTTMKTTIRTPKPRTKGVRHRLKTTIKTTRLTPKTSIKRVRPRLQTTIKITRRTPNPTTKRVHPRLKTTMKTIRRTSKPTTKRFHPRLKTTVKATKRTPKLTKKRLPPRLITTLKTTSRRTLPKSTTTKRTIRMSTKKTVTMATPKYKIKNPYKTIKPRHKLINLNPKRTSQYIQRRTTATTRQKPTPKDIGQKTKLKYETIRLKHIVVPITRSSRLTTKSTIKIPKTRSTPSDKTREIPKPTRRSPKNPYTPKVILRRTTPKKPVTSGQRRYTPKAISTLRKNSPTRGVQASKYTTKMTMRSLEITFPIKPINRQTKQDGSSEPTRNTNVQRHKIKVTSPHHTISTTLNFKYHSNGLTSTTPKEITNGKKNSSRSTKNRFTTKTTTVQTKQKATTPSRKRTYSPKYKISIIEQTAETKTSVELSTQNPKITKRHKTKPARRNPFATKRNKLVPTITTKKVSLKGHIIKMQKKSTSNSVVTLFPKVTTRKYKGTRRSPKNPYTSKSIKHLEIEPKTTFITKSASFTKQKSISKSTSIKPKTSHSWHKKRTTFATKWPMRPKKNPFLTKYPTTKRTKQTTHAQKETTSSHKTKRTTQYPMTKTTETPNNITPSLVRLHSISKGKTTSVKQRGPVKNPYSTQPPSHRTTSNLSTSFARITSVRSTSKQRKPTFPTKPHTRQTERTLRTSHKKTTLLKKWGKPKKNPFLTKMPKIPKIITLSPSTALPKSSRSTSERQGRAKGTRHPTKNVHPKLTQKTHTKFVQETTTAKSKIPKIDLIRKITKHPVKLPKISQSWLIPDKNLSSRTMKRSPLTTTKHKQVTTPKTVRTKVTRNHSRTPKYKMIRLTTAKIISTNKDKPFKSKGDVSIHTTRPPARISTPRQDSNHIKNSRKWAMVQWTTRGPMKSADDIRSWLIPEKSPSRTKDSTKADVIKSSRRVTKRLPTTRIVERSSKKTLTKQPLKAVSDFHSWLLSKDEYQPGLVHSETDTDWDANGFLKDAWTAAPFDEENKGKSLSWLIPAPTNLPIKQDNNKRSSIEPKLRTLLHSRTILSTTLIPCLSSLTTNSVSRSSFSASEETSKKLSSIRRLIKESQKSTTKRPTTTRRLNEHSRKPLASNSAWEMTPMLKCKAINTIVAGMDKWCFLNCNTGNCPRHLCKCTEQEKNIPVSNDTESGISLHVSPHDNSMTHNHRRTDYIWSKSGELRCKAIGRYRGIQRIDDWCRATCKVATCPYLICGCYRR